MFVSSIVLKNSGYSKKFVIANAFFVFDLNNSKSDGIGSIRCCSDNKPIKPFGDIPGPRPSLPLIGTGWQYLKWFGRYELSKLHEAHQDKHLRFGDIIKEEFEWRRPLVHVFNPNDIETVFRNQGKYPDRPPNEFVRHFRLKNPHKYPNVGLAHLTGEEWYKQRSLLAPALMKLKVIQNHIPSLNAICDDLTDYLLKKRDPINGVVDDLQDVTYRLALESICMMCLDSRMKCLSVTSPTADGNLFISATKLLFESYNELYYGLPLWKFFETASYKKLARAESLIYETASKYIQSALNKLKQTKGSEAKSVLETLLKIDGVTESDIKIIIIDFIAGGIFTVSNSLALLLFHLAKNPHVQDKLYAEIKQIMTGGNEMTADKLDKMQYLKACVKECFRLNSPVPGIMRILPNSVSLSGYQVPAGTIIFSHLLVASRQSQHFDDPLSFNPDRWLGSNRRRIHPFALLPFGYGNRMCAGRRFSELELYTATAKIIYNFSLETVTQEIDLLHAFIVVPAHPIAIKFISRNKH